MVNEYFFARLYDSFGHDFHFTLALIMSKQGTKALKNITKNNPDVHFFMSTFLRARGRLSKNVM